MLVHEVSGLSRAQGACGDLVDRKGDPVLREKLPRLDAGGSPLQMVENCLGHAAVPFLSRESSYHTFPEDKTRPDFRWSIKARGPSDVPPTLDS